MPPRDGLLVRAHGALTVYERRGDMQAALGGGMEAVELRAPSQAEPSPSEPEPTPVEPEEEPEPEEVPEPEPEERPEDFGLAVSLHAPNHELRQEIMRIEKRFPIPELMESIREYQAESGRRVTFEYLLIDGLNDSGELADQLADLIAYLKEATQ